MINVVKTEPTMKDVLDLHKKEILISINVQHIGRVVELHLDKQTVDVKINYDMVIYERDRKGVLVERIVSYPTLRNVNLEFLRGGKFRVTMPIKIGDTCIISFNDRDISNWYNGILSGKVKSPRLHSMSDAFARVGISNKDTQAEYDQENIHIGTDATYLKVKENSLEIKKGSIHLGETLSDLCGSLEDLITAIKAIQVTCALPGNPSSTPINAPAFIPIETALGQVKNKLSELLE